MKVCILTSQYFGWGKIGGFGSMSRKLAEALAANGVETSVIVPRRPGQAPVERLGGVTVHSFKPLSLREAVRLIDAVPADVFHSQDPTLLTALAQRRRPDARHLVTCRDPRDRHDWMTEFRDATWSRRIKIPLNWLLEASPIVRRAVRNADGVYTPAYFLQDKVRRMYKPKGEVGFLPNLIDVPETLPPKPDQPTFTFIGRLDRRKRPELFLELAERFADYHFIVVGKAESEERDQYLRGHYGRRDNVEWVGYVDRFKEPGRIDEILKRTWALVNTASREGLPLTFLEAAGYACAIISHVNPDNFAERFGVHVADSDFQDAVMRLMSNADHRVALTEKARRYVLDRYDSGNALAHHCDSYMKNSHAAHD